MNGCVECDGALERGLMDVMRSGADSTSGRVMLGHWCAY